MPCCGWCKFSKSDDDEVKYQEFEMSDASHYKGTVKMVIKPGRVEATPVPHGEGEVRFASGNVYRGAFTDGTPDGFGIMFFMNGSKLTGNFRKGEVEGFCVFQNGDFMWIGVYRKGKPHKRYGGVDNIQDGYRQIIKLPPEGEKLAEMTGIKKPRLTPRFAYRTEDAESSRFSTGSKSSK